MERLHIDPELSPLEARDDDGRVLVVCEPQKGDGSIIEQHAAAAARMAHIVRAANCHAKLVEALEGVIRVADRATVEFDAARAAVAEAKGQTP